MAVKDARRTEQGHEIALRLRDHAGRLRPLLRSESDGWSAVSLPLIFLAGLAFESFFAQRQQRFAEVTLDVVTLVAVFGFAWKRLRHGMRDRHDPVLVVGSVVLLVGSAIGLLGLFPDDVVPELMLKTIGIVMIVFAVDRLDRRTVVEMLESSEEYLESFFESIPDPLVVIGEGRRVAAANRVAINTFGEQILGLTCCEAYLGHEKGCVDCTVTQAWNRRKPRFELVRDERGARRYEVTTFPLFGPRGFSGKLLQQIRDVSAHAESEDRASLLGDVVNSVQDPVLTLDLRGELRHRNRAAEAMFGPIVGHEPCNGDVLPFLENSDRQAFVAALRDFVPWERETQLRGRDGSERIAKLCLAPIRAVDDRLLGTVVIVHDVTDLERLQTQLAQNEKLSAIGEMVSGVAHELNNPLTAVFGFAQLLLSEQMPREQKEEVRHIFTHAERCKKIIDGLLKFARRHNAERVRAQLNEVVQSTVDLLGYQMRLANVRLETDLDPALPESMMDSFQVQQVLINLLTNAQHAIQEKGRAGVVRMRTRRLGGERMLLEVEDDGCGMPDHVLRRIFDPFFTTKGVGKGTGLGLSLSYGIVREHGGTLTATSRAGEGSTFRVELPVVHEPTGSASIVKEHVQPLPIPTSRILVVDDEPIVLELMTQFLRSDGHTVVAVASADEALKEATRREFDLVFSDWRMPGRGGAELYEELCERSGDYRGRVVFLTGDALCNEVTRVARQDGNAVLNKPFTLDSIRAAIAKVWRPVEPLAVAEPEPAPLR